LAFVVMYNSDTELLFPPRVIPKLRDLRGEQWRNLVEQVMKQEAMSVDLLAFVLMMIRLNKCATCHADSFRAMRGCTQCAQQATRRFRGSDEELVELFAQAREEVEAYLGEDGV